MRPVTRLFLILALAALDVTAQPPRPGPGRWLVSYPTVAPTARSLVGLLRGRIAPRTLDEFAGDRVPGVRDLVVRVGPPLAPGRIGAARLVTVGARSDDDVVVVPSAARVRRTLTRLPFGVRRIAVLGDVGTWGAVADQVTRLPIDQLLSKPDRAGDVMTRLAREVDAFLIPDERALLQVAELAAHAAADAGLPTITTAPWLARTACAVGIVPDLEAAAITVAQRIRRSAAAGLPEGPRDFVGLAVPALTTIHVGVWHRTGLTVDHTTAARAHRIYGAAEGGRP